MNSPPAAGRACNYILPNAMAIHSIDNKGNIHSMQIKAIRRSERETSTLVSFVVPQEADDKICTAGIFAGRLGHGDTVNGTHTVDVFSTLLTDINNTPTGNQRNKQLSRLRFNTGTNRFDFVTDEPSEIQNFKGKAGVTLQWEIVAVGEDDLVDIRQDFSCNSSGTPNGIFIEY
jgi:hypothetical protein